jgi:hypothetical protein
VTSALVRYGGVLKVVASLAALAGLACLGVAIWYVFAYATDNPNNANRGEYLEGAIQASVFAVPFWLVVSACLFPVRASISRRVYVAANAPGALLACLYLAMVIYILVKAMSGRAT